MAPQGGCSASLAALLEENASLQAENEALRAEAAQYGSVPAPAAALDAAEAGSEERLSERLETLRRDQQALYKIIHLKDELQSLQKAKDQLQLVAGSLQEENSELLSQLEELGPTTPKPVKLEDVTMPAGSLPSALEGRASDISSGIRRGDASALESCSDEQRRELIVAMLQAGIFTATSPSTTPKPGTIRRRGPPDSAARPPAPAPTPTLEAASPALGLRFAIDEPAEAVPPAAEPEVPPLPKPVPEGCPKSIPARALFSAAAAKAPAEKEEASLPLELLPTAAPAVAPAATAAAPAAVSVSTPVPATVSGPASSVPGSSLAATGPASQRAQRIFEALQRGDAAALHGLNEAIKSIPGRSVSADLEDAEEQRETNVRDMLHKVAGQSGQGQRAS
mmetsp:Transcript_15102/g.53004  ORF Transcript_15102/g.53004 Transcript_15102/m.53004 type:complete len:395 (-) Transcript_15102:169-1353(-)